MFLTAISSYVPTTKVDNFAQANAFGKPSSFIETKIGAHQLPRMHSSEDSSDLAIQAVSSLFDNININKQEIDVICVVTQNPAARGIPHTSALVHSSLDLSSTCSAFDISLGCSGYVYGLSILSAFLDANGLNHGVLVTSDPYSSIIDPSDPNTSLLFGDASTASLISRSPSHHCLKVGRLIGFTDGKNGDSIKISTSGKLEMNGRAVFNFALKQVPKQIKDCLYAENVMPEGVDVFVMHQGSFAIIDAISRSFPGLEHKFLKDIKDTGNTISSSVPLLLQKVFNSSDPLPNKILISGFGVLAATMLLRSIDFQWPSTFRIFFRFSKALATQEISPLIRKKLFRKIVLIV